MNVKSKQPSEVLDRDDDDEEEEDKWYFSSGTEWQTAAIHAMSLDCIFREGTVIKPGTHQLGLICAVQYSSRSAEGFSGQVTEGNSTCNLI